MRNIKIPTFLGVVLVLLIVAGLFVTTQGVDKITNIFSRAEESVLPQGVTIANITNSSFTVFWTTETRAEGAIFYGESVALSGGVAVDERAIGQSGEKFQTHLVKVNGLSEATKYYFKIGESEPSSQMFDATTGPALAANPSLEPLVGTALSASGAPLNDGVAIWQAPGASKIAVLTKSDGTFSLPLALARSTNLASPYEPQAGSPEKIIVLSGSGEGTINCQSGSVTSLPSVKIGQTLDCDADAEADAEVGGFGDLLKATTGTPSSSQDNVKLNIESGETVSTGLPTFSGKVGPKQVVKIVIHSEDVYSATVIAKPDGTWTWTPPANLSPGEHTVTMTIVNANGTTQTITKTFFVSAGEPLLPITSGTASATITPIPTTIADDELLESGVEDGTILALTMGVMFTILGIGAIFILN